MSKSAKYLMIYFALFFLLTMSCSEKNKNSGVEKSECEKIKDVMTDCMGLHQGALGYIDSCGTISLSVIESLNSCEEIFDYIEQKN